MTVQTIGRLPAAGQFDAGEQKQGILRQATPLGLLIFFYILVGVGRIHEYLSFLSPLHPALLAFFAIVAYVVVKPNSIDIGLVFSTWPGRAVILLSVLSIASAVFGISLGASAKYILDELASLLIFAFIMVAATGSFGVQRASLFGFVASSIFWLYLSYFVLGASGQGAIGGIMRLDYEYTYDPNDMCVIFNTALPLTLLFYRTDQRRWMRNLMLAGAVGVPGAVALSGSRGGLLAMILTCAALMVLVREVSVGKKVGLVFAALLGLAAMAPEGYWKQMETILEPKEDYNWSDAHGRRQVWLRGMGYVAQFPVFGLGVNNFPRAEGTIGPLARTHVPGTPLRFIAPHNTPLQITTELGIPAFGVWVSVILLGIFWLPFQRRGLSRESDDPEERFVYHSCTYLPAAWVGFAASCVWVSFAYLVPYYLLLAYTAGVIVSLRRVRAGGGTHARVNAAPRLAGPPPEWRSRRAVRPAPQAWQPRNAATRSRLLEPGDGLAPER